jgi:hypothetical protein
MEVIQPRLASRYESPNAADGPVSAQHIDTELIDEVPTSGATDLSHQTSKHPPVESPREARLPLSERQRIQPDEAPSRADGLMTTDALSFVPPTRQQPPLPTQDIFPSGDMGSESHLSQSAFDPTRVVALQLPPSRLEATLTRPSVKPGPQQPDQHRPAPPLAADGDGMSTPLSRRGAVPERRPRLEPASSPIVIEPLALRREAQPAGTGNGTSATVPRRSPAQEDRPPLEPVPQPIMIERIALRQDPRAAGIGAGTEAALLRSTGQQEPRPPRPVAIQLSDVEGVTPPTEPSLTDTAHSGLPPTQGVSSPIVATIVARPQVVPYVKPTTPPTMSEPTAAPELAPTIQVTIGRIEVRATPPPAPSPQRQRVAPPVMSLDEYLRQRASGGAG